MCASPLSLPALQQTILDRATLDALFRDLAHCAQVQSVTTRTPGQPRDVAPAALTLDAAHAGLTAATLRSVQIRYRHDDRTWCDTLMAGPTGVRLVRICEDDIAASVANDA